MVGVTGYNLEDTYVRVRLTQSRLEMALSSVNPPSSYRLKQIGNIAEYQRSRVALGVTLISQCLCLGSVRRMHMLRQQVARRPSGLIPIGRVMAFILI